MGGGGQILHGERLEVPAVDEILGSEEESGRVLAWHLPSMPSCAQLAGARSEVANTVLDTYHHHHVNGVIHLGIG